VEPPRASHAAMNQRTSDDVLPIRRCGRRPGRRRDLIDPDISNESWDNVGVSRLTRFGFGVCGCVLAFLGSACGDGDSSTRDAPDSGTPEPDANGCRGLRELHEEGDYEPIDLKGADLRGVDMSCTHIFLVDLTAADMTGANLHGSLIELTDIAQVTLRDADLSGVTAGVILTNADLRNVNLRGADLSSSSLAGADLRGAETADTMMLGVDLTWTKAFDLSACPTLGPTNCTLQAEGRFAIVRDNMDLVGADLSLMDWNVVFGYMNRYRAYDLAACPELPEGFHCVEQPATGGWMIHGLRASLLDADVTGADLTGVKQAALDECPTELPEGWRCLSPTGSFAKFLFAPGMDLAGIYFDELNLEGADLSGADLTNATLFRSDLTEVNLEDATLDNLSATDLQGCPAALPGDFHCVSGQSVNSNPPSVGNGFAVIGPRARLGLCPSFEYTYLADVDLSDMNLAGIGMEGVTLTGANLSGTHLRGASLSEADLSDADLSGADLTDANLGPQQLEIDECFATYVGARLENAILTDVTWSNTTCPDGTNSDDNGGTCEGALTPGSIPLP
jgi:uncharacterized protein YjbI with pentapeptide repeats